MAKGRFKGLLTAMGAALDGGSRAQEAERRAEVARLHMRDGRAIPQHIAIIMDGNGRWATSRRMPRSMGHRAGVEALRRVVQLCDDYHVPMLTVYAFSTENWGRPADEVDALLRLFWETIRSDLEKLHRNGVRLRHIGRIDGLSPEMQEAIQHMESLTHENTKMQLNVCFNYGGRAEIVDAVRQIVAAGVAAEQVTEELVERYLYTRGLPDPDLVIRTAGEMRLSNYLIWQLAYAEYYATATLWPDFDDADFVAALDAFAQRKRRFGKTDAQIAAEQAAAGETGQMAEAVEANAVEAGAADAAAPSLAEPAAHAR